MGRSGVVCRVCGNRLRKRMTKAQHIREPCGMGDLCLGCFVGSTQLELWLLRATDRTIMGAWAEGALRFIAKNPKRFLNAHGNAQASEE